MEGNVSFTVEQMKLEQNGFMHMGIWNGKNW